MFPNKLIELFVNAFRKNLLDGYMLAVDDSAGFKSVPQTFTGNTASTTVLSPSVAGRRLAIKGITMSSQGAGIIKLKRSSDDETILPIYGSNFLRNSTSSSLNIVLEPDETVYIVIENNNAGDETFIGLSYIELE